MGVPVKRGSAKKAAKSSKQQRQQRSADDYFTEAEFAYMNDDLDGARRSYTKALEMEPENIEYLDAYGSFLAECGHQEEAITVLTRACDIQPDTGFQKFMYLGQVLDQLEKSTEAEAALRKGIEILRKDLETARTKAANDDEQEEQEDEEDDEFDDSEFTHPEALQENLSSALCSLAELLMGSAEDTNPASYEECERLLEEAQHLCATNPEPLQALCSLRRLQNREDEALPLLKQSMAIWFKPIDFEADDREEEEDDMDLEGQELPSYEFRFETAKLLLELDETTDDAVQVLEGLLEENDTVCHVWFMLAVAYRAGGDLEEAAEAVDEGLNVVKALKVPEDDEMVVALNALKVELADINAAGGGEDDKK